MTQKQSANPAERYQEYLVSGIHARWTPLFLDTQSQRPASGCWTWLAAWHCGAQRRAAASIVPDSEMDGAARSDLVQTVGREIGATLQEYTEGDAASFPMHAHFAVAQA